MINDFENSAYGINCASAQFITNSIWLNMCKFTKNYCGQFILQIAIFVWFWFLEDENKFWIPTISFTEKKNVSV